MHEPPKIALARLKANPQPSGNAPGAFPGGSHPDANLLAAFVEKSLTERERLQVLEHLAACADCREVAVLTLPAGDEAAGPVRAPGRKRWNPWPVLRWGALAAILGTVALVVVLHPEVWRRRSVAWNETRPPTDAVVTARQNPSSPPVALPSSEATSLKKKTEAKQSANELASMAKDRAPLRDAAKKGEAARADAPRHVTMLASSLPPAPVKVENIPGTDAVRAEKQRGSPANAVAMPAPSPSSAAIPSGTPTSVGGVMAKAAPQPEAPPPSLPSAPQTVEGIGAAGGGLAEASRAKGISSKSTRGDIHLEAQAQTLETRALRKDAGFGAAAPPAEWSVSTKGKLCRSTDGGKTLEEVHVARGVKLRAVAARGNDVWAGGTGGALFHSTDRGATWKRSGINGNTITETIEAIQIQDALHLTVTLATGGQWITEDAGQTWQKKP